MAFSTNMKQSTMKRIANSLLFFFYSLMSFSISKKIVRNIITVSLSSFFFLASSCGLQHSHVLCSWFLFFVILEEIACYIFFYTYSSVYGTSNNGILFLTKKANETKTIGTYHSLYSPKEDNNLSRDKYVGRNDCLSFIFYHSKHENAEYFVWGVLPLLVRWINKNIYFCQKWSRQAIATMIKQKELETEYFHHQRNQCTQLFNIDNSQRFPL